jgi:universal stress protein E
MSKILVIADLKGEGIATPRGLQLADKLGLETEVVAFVHAHLGNLKLKKSEIPAIKEKLLKDREAEVQGRIDRNVRHGQKVRLKVIWEKDVAAWVVKQCAKGGYDLVVKTGRRSETLAHTSTDWQLLRECSSPVVIVAEKKWSRTQPVLACLDLGTSLSVKKKLNEVILQRAIGLAEVLGVELEIIAAIEVPALLADLDLVDPRAYAEDAKQNMAPLISSLADKFELPEKAFKVKRGPVEKVITSQAAAKRAQLVVMGTVGRKGVKARLLGNTAEKVLRHLKTDVLALKP